MPDGYGVWEGVWQGNNVSYEGEWKDGKPNGYGVFTEYFPEGEGPKMIMSGEVVGVRNTYDGEWTDGLPNGQMTYTYYGVQDTDGREIVWTYTGNAVEGYFHGDVVVHGDVLRPDPGPADRRRIYHLNEMRLITGITYFAYTDSPFYEPYPGDSGIGGRLGDGYATWPWD
jgi:hypothetical protein